MLGTWAEFGCWSALHGLFLRWWSHYIAQADLNFEIILPQPSKWLGPSMHLCQKYYPPCHRSRHHQTKSHQLKVTRRQLQSQSYNPEGFVLIHRHLALETARGLRMGCFWRTGLCGCVLASEITVGFRSCTLSLESQTAASAEAAQLFRRTKSAQMNISRALFFCPCDCVLSTKPPTMRGRN